MRHISFRALEVNVVFFITKRSNPYCNLRIIEKSALWEVLVVSTHVTSVYCIDKLTCQIMCDCSEEGLQKLSSVGRG